MMKTAVHARQPVFLYYGHINVYTIKNEILKLQKKKIVIVICITLQIKKQKTINMLCSTITFTIIYSLYSLPIFLFIDLPKSGFMS